MNIFFIGIPIVFLFCFMFTLWLAWFMYNELIIIDLVFSFISSSIVAITWPVSLIILIYAICTGKYKRFFGMD